MKTPFCLVLLAAMTVVCTLGCHRRILVPGGFPAGLHGRAALLVRAAERSPYPIPRTITGKFCEHLGRNISHGMDAQILRNPTFADYPFRAPHGAPDGGVRFYIDDKDIARGLRRGATRLGWPESALDRLVEARGEGLACWWIREGDRGAVRVSPDTGPHGGRAQRIEVNATGQGIAQWTYLPLHRVREYAFELLVRSPDVKSLSVSLVPVGKKRPCATTSATGVSREWQTLHGVLRIAPDRSSDVVYRFAVTANTPGQFVIARALLRPADHVNGADPDIVRLLKESNLPILRWPGGNFASGYHWEDGIGPAERRPTRPNPAWGGVEPNLFGTDEFIAFCRAVGCEPMICVNAGNGTPLEAARWIEYCNGAPNSPMGARRATNGHPEPYRVRHWEVGNELWGRWQVHWTTAEGYVDRFQEFAEAMQAADPTITLYACGAPVLWGESWNDALIAKAGPRLRVTTDHPLIGGQVPAATDPLDVYRDFMAVPDVLEEKWADLRSRMQEARIKQPRLAVTELQMFARIGEATDDEKDASASLRRENLVSPATLAEALYDVLVYHAAVRLSPFVEMVTHSATVNHGGGLSKDKERVYANPCHYAQAAFSAFAGATPLAIDLECPTERAPLVLPDLKKAVKKRRFRVLDALAALATDGALLLSIVHRGTQGPIDLEVELSDFAAGPTAQVLTLSAQVPWAANSLEEPKAVYPVDSTVEVLDAKLILVVEPYTVMRVRIPTATAR